MEDSRWKQRFSSFQRALPLASAVAIGQQGPLSQLEQQGLMKAFEFTQELAWNVMKDYFESTQLWLSECIEGGRT